MGVALWLMLDGISRFCDRFPLTCTDQTSYTDVGNRFTTALLRGDRPTATALSAPALHPEIETWLNAHSALPVHLGSAACGGWDDGGRNRASGATNPDNNTATVSITRGCGGKYNQSLAVEAVLSYENETWKVTELKRIDFSD